MALKTRVKRSTSRGCSSSQFVSTFLLSEQNGLPKAGMNLYPRAIYATNPVQSRTEDRNPLATFVHAFTMAIGNIDHAPLEFKALILQDVRLTQTVLIDRMFTHYRQAVLLQLYRVLGSIDFVGSTILQYSCAHFVYRLEIRLDCSLMSARVLWISSMSHTKAS